RHGRAGIRPRSATHINPPGAPTPFLQSIRAPALVWIEQQRAAHEVERRSQQQAHAEVVAPADALAVEGRCRGGERRNKWNGAPWAKGLADPRRTRPG
ncbi:MAG TPA: hypothetical protein DEP84_26950, partial [Chloroflexi bacterium]|nr:hypothetical protein [Chloroflexota bacterium]